MLAPLDAVRSAVAVVCGVPVAGLGADTVLADLGADSLALVSIADVVEAELNAGGGALSIADASLARMVTIGHIVDYIVSQRGVLAGA
jgi:acyl carrier protein